MHSAPKKDILSRINTNLSTVGQDVALIYALFAFDGYSCPLFAKSKFSPPYAKLIKA
jgi:hypothetical protein